MWGQICGAGTQGEGWGAGCVGWGPDGSICLGVNGGNGPEPDSPKVETQHSLMWLVLFCPIWMYLTHAILFLTCTKDSTTFRIWYSKNNYNKNLIAEKKKKSTADTSNSIHTFGLKRMRMNEKMPPINKGCV